MTTHRSHEYMSVLLLERSQPLKHFVVGQVVDASELFEFSGPPVARCLEHFRFDDGFECLWYGANAIGFAKKLFSGNNLLIRATPYSDSSIQVEFPIAGLEQAIAPLRKACKW